ncbi:MAG: UDP-N-acetylmuramoyl-L-alanine--D-glutamate ligase [Treponemataceae bacterium]
MFNINDAKNLNVTVMGLGLNGGGLATAIFFAKLGSQVTVTDLKDKNFLHSSIEKLKPFPNIRFVLGRHEEKDFVNADLVIKNPGVKRKGNKFLSLAKKIETDISIFLQITNAPILAVTGSKGKSSTVSALHYGLVKAGYNSFLGGNITVSPLSFYEKVKEDTPVVLELSSFQLNDLHECNFFKPHISILTPIYNDHQNWYDNNMQEYVADKKVIYKNQNKNDFTICNAEQSWGFEFANETKAVLGFYSAREKSICAKLPKNAMQVFFNEKDEGILKTSRSEILLLPAETKVISFPLKQNLLNAAFAMYLYGVKPELIPSIMQNYKGLEYRLELFHEYGNLQFYDDTTATVPEATVSALSAFENPRFEKPIWIGGGTDKNLDFTQLGIEAKKAKAIFLLPGTATDLLKLELKKNGLDYFDGFDTLEALLLEVKKYLKTNSIKTQNKKVPIVLSPGAASFGLFKNEFDRGQQFKTLVKSLF